MIRNPALATLLLAGAAAASAADLTLEVSGPVTGTLYAAVYAAADGWLQDGRAVAQQRGTGNRLVFAGLAPGRFAVTVFEDTNGNGQLDRNLPGVRVDIALFRMDWRDAQVSALVTDPLPLIGVANVGQARSQGLEATLQAPLGAHGRAGLRMAFTDAATRAPFTTAAGVPVAAGARLPGTPRRQLAADLAHALPLPGGRAGEARADVSARSRQPEAIGGAGTSPGHALLGLGLAAQRGPWHWQLRLDNAGDIAAVAGAEVVDRRGLPPLTFRYLAEPRRWSLTLRHEH